MTIKKDSEFDLVYILKKSDNNPDLKFSLRSVCEHCKFRNIWFIGYKPKWTKNVNVINTVQTKGKWKNSILNITTACKCNDISEDFILMNDDFFAIKDIHNWRMNLNVRLGQVDIRAAKYEADRIHSRWRNAFSYVNTLLTDLHSKTKWDFETHIPMIINKKNFLYLMNNPLVEKFNETDKILHKRSLYKNLFKDPELPEPRRIRDVKIFLNRDLTDEWLHESWLSVFDNVIGNIRDYPILNNYLKNEFPNKCKYEI